MDSASLFPPWYLYLGLAWSLFQGFRGAVETRLANPGARAWQPWERMVVLYIHDFAFRFICTMAGFISFYMSVALFNQLVDQELTTGDAVLILLSFLVGVIGVAGQLHFVILMGKRPLVGGAHTPGE